MVAPSDGVRTTRATPIGADQVDLVSRMISMGKTHRTFAGTSSMCLAVAAAIPGTVVTLLPAGHCRIACASATPLALWKWAPRYAQKATIGGWRASPHSVQRAASWMASSTCHRAISRASPGLRRRCAVMLTRYIRAAMTGGMKSCRMMAPLW